MFMRSSPKPLRGHFCPMSTTSRLYSSGKLTLARAAREAGVSLWEMMDYVKTKKIAAQYDLESVVPHQNHFDKRVLVNCAGDQLLSGTDFAKQENGIARSNCFNEFQVLARNH